ncbi:VPLPA-CTERM sorting domain-containing protein [Paracoccus sp. (in: a-proteobacteria)]|uniref:VPLPA-CTERM sorting domain-containing protein n=1 Tax=Paracoccus sp. TaxID=267 RepID=UPI003A83AC9B
MINYFASLLRGPVAAIPVAVSLAFAAPAAHAAVKQNILLTIDVTDPGAVVIESTGTSSEIDLYGDGWDGVTLLDLMTAAQDVFIDRTGGDTADNFHVGTGNERVLTFDFDASDGLSLYNLSDKDPAAPSEAVKYVFSTASAAFTGSAILDFTALAAFLPSPGDIGRILASPWDNSGDLEIGSWSVITRTPAPSPIPLPAGLPLVVTGAGLLALFRRRNES